MMTRDFAWLWPLIVSPFVGSFLAALAIRLPAGRPWIWERSRCPYCAAVLGVLDLIPVASWLASRGRCRHCQAAVTPFYAIVELGALAIALWALWTVPQDQLWASCILGWGLLALAAIDARDFLLPDTITLPLVVAGLAAAFFGEPDDLPQHVAGAALGAVAFLAIRIAYRHLRGREGLGLGDVKLMAVAGAWVSWVGLPSVVLIAAVASFAWVLARGKRQRPIALDTRLPFGPGLCLGIWMVWLYGPLN